MKYFSGTLLPSSFSGNSLTRFSVLLKLFWELFPLLGLLQSQTWTSSTSDCSHGFSVSAEQQSGSTNNTNPDQQPAQIHHSGLTVHKKKHLALVSIHTHTHNLFKKKKTDDAQPEQLMRSFKVKQEVTPSSPNGETESPSTRLRPADSDSTN